MGCADFFHVRPVVDRLLLGIGFAPGNSKEMKPWQTTMAAAATNLSIS